MTAIDVNARAKSLGIDYEDYHTGFAMLDDREQLMDFPIDRDEFIEAVKSIGGKPMVALIRWYRYDERYPEHFDWNGAIER